VKQAKNDDRIIGHLKDDQLIPEVLRLAKAQVEIGQNVAIEHGATTRIIPGGGARRTNGGSKFSGVRRPTFDEKDAVVDDVELSRRAHHQFAPHTVCLRFSSA
jgi:hypothetical protein